MDISLPANLTNSADSHLALSRAHHARGTSSVDDIDADQNTRRKTRQQNGPGIRVTLHSLSKEPQIEEYRGLKFDGRRKGSSKAVENESVIQMEQFDQGTRSVNPRSKIVLDSFIQQMGGAEFFPTPSTGINVNTSV